MRTIQVLVGNASYSRMGAHHKLDYRLAHTDWQLDRDALYKFQWRAADPLRHYLMEPRFRCKRMADSLDVLGRHVRLLATEHLGVTIPRSHQQNLQSVIRHRHSSIAPTGPP